MSTTLSCVLLLLSVFVSAHAQEEEVESIYVDPKQPQQQGGEAALIILFFDHKTTIPTHTYKVDKRYKHNPVYFTQGLECYDDGFIESTGMYGSSRVVKTHMNGTQYAVMGNKKEEFGEGLTVWDNYIIQLTWREKWAIVYNADEWAWNSTFKIDHEGWGVAHDADTLFITDGTNVIKHYSGPPEWQPLKNVSLCDNDGVEIKHFLWKDPRGSYHMIPVRLNELEMVGDELWANLWPTETVARMNPYNGSLLGFIDFRGLMAEAAQIPNDYPLCRMDVFNGIATRTDENAEREIFVTGKCWPLLFEVELVEREDCGVKGELVALPVTHEIIETAEVHDFYAPKVLDDD